MTTSWSKVSLRRMVDCWDYLRVPLNAEERHRRPGTVPYWGASSIQGYVDEPLVSEEVVLLGEDGAPFFDRDRPVAFRVNEPIWPNNHVHVLKPDERTDARWLAYALNDVDYSLYVAGSTRDKLTQGALMTITLITPPTAEQRQIANYLDRETSRIDTLVEEQQRLAETLRERKAAISDRHFYTRDGKRETTLRRVLRPLARPAVPGLGVVTAYRDGTVTLRSNRRDDGYTFSETEHGYQEVRVGDLVFHALDGFAGAIGISDSRGNATPVYHVCEVINDDNPAYLAMLLRYLGVSGYLATQAPNVRQRSVDFRNWATFARVPVALPSADVQRDVVAEVREQAAKIDVLIAETERFIELVRERRSALITAAVTGQIGVSESVA